MKSNNSQLLYKLFYWNENNRYVFSRTKFISWAVFFVTFIPLLKSPPIYFSLLFALLFALIAFVIGFFIHRITHIDSSFYNGNFTDDLKHFLLYWYEGKNKFRLSKTKLITLVIILIGFLAGLENHFAGEAGGYILGTIFVFVLIAAIAFLIGYVIHRIISKDDSSKQTPVYSNNKPANDIGEKNVITSEVDENISSNLRDYQLKTNELKKEFDEKESKTRDLINAKFTPPQITNEKFMAVVDNCSKVFNEQYESILNIINFAKGDSAKIEHEINSKIEILTSITDKLDDLSSELVINMSKTNDDDIHNILNDMEDLITSINTYDD